MTDENAAVAVVRLKNGGEVVSTLVEALNISLSSILWDHPVAFYELVMSCRDSDHVLFGNATEVLCGLGLIEGVDIDGRARIHGDIRSVVLSAVEGDGLDMHLEPPLDG